MLRNSKSSLEAHLAWPTHAAIAARWDRTWTLHATAAISNRQLLGLLGPWRDLQDWHTHTIRQRLPV